MDDLVIIIIIFIVIAFIVYTTSSKEHLIEDPVAFNNNDTPINSIITVTDKFNNLLDNLFKNQTNIEIDDSFTLYNTNLAFTLQDIFKSLALEYFNKLPNNTFSNDKCFISESTPSLKNIYFKFISDAEQNNNAIYIFNFNLVNPKNLFTTNIKAGILTSEDALSNLRSERPGSSKVLFMKLDKTTFKTNLDFEALPLLQFPTYYTITNTLHLLDPFLTNNNIITPAQVVAFNQILDIKEQELLGKQV